MIVKNEEETLARCLASIHDLVDEIIVVDTGSVDQTKKIARQFTKRIYDFEWIDNFSAARNYSFQLATKEYTMWLDADDVIDERNRELLQQLKVNLNPSVNSVTMEYLVNPHIEGSSVYKFRRNRLIKTDCKFKWKGSVHEYLDVFGPIYHSNICIHHRKEKNDSTLRNLLIYEKQLQNGEDLTPRDLFYYANELYLHNNIKKAIYYYNLFLDREDGWKEDKITSCSRLADCYNQLGNRKEEKKFLLKSFDYDQPRAEFCCRLGRYYLNNDRFQKAILWYEIATKLEWDDSCMGYYHVPSWTWLPHKQLGLCYYRIGNYKKAIKHIHLALKYSPNDQRMIELQKQLTRKINKENSRLC
jgi:glycosyltransferase involved in cell wall biosynthesis